MFLQQKNWPMLIRERKLKVLRCYFSHQYIGRGSICQKRDKYCVLLAKHNWYFRITANIHGSMTNAEKNNLYCHLSCSLSTAIYQLLISVIDTHRILSAKHYQNMVIYYHKAFYSTIKGHYTIIRKGLILYKIHLEWILILY